MYNVGLLNATRVNTGYIFWYILTPIVTDETSELPAQPQGLKP